MSPVDPSDAALPHPTAGLVALDEHDCFQLLARTHLGRIAVSIGALPAVFPVHYVLQGRNPVFRTGAGAKLAAASSGNVLCLEIDDDDPVAHSGWSVMVIGAARVLAEPAELTAARALPLRPWVGAGDAFVEIEASIVSGRRISPQSVGPPDPVIRT